MTDPAQLFHPDAERQPDGSVIVTFRASGMDWLVRRVLEYGAEAEAVGHNGESLKMERSRAMKPATFGVARIPTRSVRNGTPSICSAGTQAQEPGCGWRDSNSHGLSPTPLRTKRVYQFRHTRYRGTLTRPVTATPCSQWIVPLAATTCCDKREQW